MNSKVLLEYQWSYLLSLLPSEEILERTVVEFGALTRKRQIKKASTLLRLALAYGFCGLTLRQTAAWAQVADIAVLSDVALLKRLRASSDWLGHLLFLKLAERAPPPPGFSSKMRLRLVDATTISKPGSAGTDWRVHLGFNLASFRTDFVELTDVSGGETLTRFPFSSGDVVLGDRGYAHRRGLYAVRAAQADFIIRLNWQNVPLLDLDGKAINIVEIARNIDDIIPFDMPVVVASSKKDDIPAFPARLLLARKSEAAAEKSRQDVLHERSKKCRTVDPRSLEAAGYVYLLTSLSPNMVGAEQVFDLFRFRWQIELAFKRMKSLLEMDNLPAKEPLLARSFIYAKLLAALLIEDLSNEFLVFSPWGYRLSNQRPFSVAYSAHAD